MGGSRSESTTQQTVITPTATTNVGDAYASENLYQEFSPEVSKQYGNLVNLASSTGQSSLNLVRDTGEAFISSFSQITSKLFDVTEKSLESAKGAQSVALQTVAASKEAEANPEFKQVQKYIPLAILALAGAVALGITKAWRK